MRIAWACLNYDIENTMLLFSTVKPSSLPLKADSWYAMHHQEDLVEVCLSWCRGDDAVDLVSLLDRNAWHSAYAALCSVCHAVDHWYCHMREGMAANRDPRTELASCPNDPMDVSHIGHNLNLMGDLLLDFVNSNYETIFNWYCCWQTAASALSAMLRSSRTSGICWAAHWQQLHWLHLWDFVRISVPWSNMDPAMSSRVFFLVTVSCFLTPRIRLEIASTWKMVWVLRSSSPSVALRIDAKTLRSNVWGLHFVSQSMGNSISSCCGTFVLLWCVHQLQLAPNSLEQPSMLLMVDIQQKYSLLRVLLWLRYLEWGVHCCFWNQKMTIGWNYTVTKVCLLEH